MEWGFRDGESLSRGLVVIGGSAGSIETLRRVLGKLPADLPAAVLVVVHVSASGPGQLASILSRAGALPAEQAATGEVPRRGRIYVAPPDHHVMLRSGRLRVTRGPRENGHRPAIDPLFRSAAQERGPGCVGVVLSGSRDDGAAGLAVIARAGGAVLVEDPAGALFPGMPAAALAAVPDATVAPVDELASHLDRLVREQTTARIADDAGWRELNERELAVAELDTEQVTVAEETGVASGYICPDCGGPLFEIDDTGMPRYRCRVGHAWSPESLAVQQDRAVENALWHAARALRDKAALLRRMADSAVQRGSTGLAERRRRAAADAAKSAQLIEEQLAGSDRYPPG